MNAKPLSTFETPLKIPLIFVKKPPPPENIFLRLMMVWMMLTKAPPPKAVIIVLRTVSKDGKLSTIHFKTFLIFSSTFSKVKPFFVSGKLTAFFASSIFFLALSHLVENHSPTFPPFPSSSLTKRPLILSFRPSIDEDMLLIFVSRSTLSSHSLKLPNIPFAEPIGSKRSSSESPLKSFLTQSVNFFHNSEIFVLRFPKALTTDSYNSVFRNILKASAILLPMFLNVLPRLVIKPSTFETKDITFATVSSLNKLLTI